jgi:hypothetical protein
VSVRVGVAKTNPRTDTRHKQLISMILVSHSNNSNPDIDPILDLKRDSLVLAGHGSDLDAVGALSRGRHGGSGG